MTAAAVPMGRPGPGTLLSSFARHGLRRFLREPVGAFFALAFPLLFLALMGALQGDEIIFGTRIRIEQVLVPGVAVLAIAIASLTTLAVGLALDRERGVVKRLRGTPVPPPLNLLARVLATGLVSLVATTLMVVVGVWVFDVEFVVAKLPAAVLTLVLGIGVCSALGLALGALAPSSDAASAAGYGLVFPIAFVSEMLVVATDLPAVLDAIGWFFPLRHFVVALQEFFDPTVPGAGFAWSHLAVMALWGGGALAVAAWRLRAEPRTAGGSRSTASPAAVERAVTLDRAGAHDVGRPGLARARRSADACRPAPAAARTRDGVLHHRASGRTARGVHHRLRRPGARGPGDAAQRLRGTGPRDLRGRPRRVRRARRADRGAARPWRPEAGGRDAAPARRLRRRSHRRDVARSPLRASRSR